MIVTATILWQQEQQQQQQYLVATAKDKHPVGGDVLVLPPLKEQTTEHTTRQ
jgi:hypothetical protein